MMGGRIVAVILAGGRASRLGGGDKPLQDLGGEPILSHIIRNLMGQVGTIAVNANGDPTRFQPFGLPVLADEVPDFAGPLAGILTAMEWAATLNADAVLTVAGDTPFFPANLAARLQAARPSADHITVAVSASRPHPTFALWPVGIAGDLRGYLRDPQNRKVTAFMTRHPCVDVEFEPLEIEGAKVDPFFNINTPEDLAEARRLVQRRKP